MIGIPLLDHVIVGSGRYVSIAEQRLLYAKGAAEMLRPYCHDRTEARGAR
jgi:hypothetical protein